jgi:8-oxo-dGTP pyrophosphatase MutT (NUDIX family)
MRATARNVIALAVIALSGGACTWRQGIVAVRWPKEVLRLRASGLLYMEGRYLVNRYAGKPPVIELFGGGVEPEETPMDAVRREWREELGFEPAVGPLLAVVQRRWEADGVRINQVELIFAVTAPEKVQAGKWKPTERGLEAHWMTAEEVGRYNSQPAMLFRRLPLRQGEVAYWEEDR